MLETERYNLIKTKVSYGRQWWRVESRMEINARKVSWWTQSSRPRWLQCMAREWSKACISHVGWRREKTSYGNLHVDIPGSWHEYQRSSQRGRIYWLQQKNVSKLVCIRLRCSSSHRWWVQRGFPDHGQDNSWNTRHLTNRYDGSGGIFEGSRRWN